MHEKIQVIGHLTNSGWMRLKSMFPVLPKQLRLNRKHSKFWFNVLQNPIRHSRIMPNCHSLKAGSRASRASVWILL